MISNSVTKRISVLLAAVAAIVMIAVALTLVNRANHVSLGRQLALERVKQVLETPRQTMLDRGENGVVRIEGDPEFKIQVARALAILSNNVPTNYILLTNNIRAVRMGTQSGINQEDPTVCWIAKTSVVDSATWTATILVRYSLHAAMYRQFRDRYPDLQVPPEAWSDWKKQKQCFAATIDAMNDLGAPKWEVEYLLAGFKKWYPERQQDADPPPSAWSW